MLTTQDLTHYRTKTSTYLDTRLWESNLTALTLGQQGVYLWMLTGPAHEIGKGVHGEAHTIELIRRSDDAGQDPVTLTSALRSQGLIEVHGDYFTFPNVVYGEPPCHTDLGPEEACPECGTYNPERQ